jgi:hypothetical protein
VADEGILDLAEGRLDRLLVAALEELIASGLPLTPVERRALPDLDVAPCKRFATRLDPRLQKISVRHGPTEPPASR